MRRLLACLSFALLLPSVGIVDNPVALAANQTPRAGDQLSAAQDMRASIVSIAESKDQNNAQIVELPPKSNCNPYTAHWGDGQPNGCTNGWRKNAWCADFAAWVWQQAGVSFTYGNRADDINAWSASFYAWGVAHGRWHALSSGYAPQPGDVAVYGSLTIPTAASGHVAIYVSGNASSPNVVNGDWAVNWPNVLNYGVRYQTNEIHTGVPGSGLAGYVSPTAPIPPGTMLASSINGYSGTQGLNGWRYGYYPSPPNTSFKELKYYPSFPFDPTPATQVWIESPAGSYWTNITRTAQHPESRSDNDGMVATDQWAVRRWTSSYDGFATISGRLAKADTGGGDGIVGHIVVDGKVVWSKPLAFDDAVGVHFSVRVALSFGSTVDFGLGPNQTDNFDKTTFTATIRSST